MWTNNEKGAKLEAEFASWLREQLGFTKTQLRVPITGRVSERSYEVDIHAVKHSRVMRGVGVVGLGVLALAGYTFLAEDTFGARMAEKIVAFVDPTLAPYALGVIGGVGLLVWKFGSKFTTRHTWVECKNLKTTVKRQQVQKLISSVEDVRAVEDGKWTPSRVMIVSGTDFDADALNFARNAKIECYRRSSEGFERVR